MIRRSFSLIIIICALLALSSAASATDSERTLSVSGSKETVTLRVGFSRRIDISTIPESVEVGMDCGMPEMCGINPCTCGSSDRWGACSCNGLRDTLPDVRARSENENIAGVSVENGVLKIRALGAGTTTVTVTAALPHYGEGSTAIIVTILPFGAGIYIGCALCAAALCVAAPLSVRAVRRRRGNG